MPVLLVVVNGLFGIYSSLRKATGTRKAVVLTAAVITTGFVGYGLRLPVASYCALGCNCLAPVVLARVILNVGNSRNRELAAVAVNLRGPVLVIGGAGYIGSHSRSAIEGRIYSTSPRQADVR